MALFYEEVLAALEDSEIRYAVVGGTAVVLHGVPRMTADLDLVVDLDEQNVRALVDLLLGQGYVPRLPVDAHDFAKASVREGWQRDKNMKAFTFVHPKNALASVDIVFESAVPIDELVEGAIRLRAGALQISVVNTEHLIEMKRAAGRQIDLDDADALERLLRAKE